MTFRGHEGFFSRLIYFCTFSPTQRAWAIERVETCGSSYISLAIHVCLILPRLNGSIYCSIFPVNPTTTFVSIYCSVDHSRRLVASLQLEPFARRLKIRNAGIKSLFPRFTFEALSRWGSSAAKLLDHGHNVRGIERDHSLFHILLSNRLSRCKGTNDSEGRHQFRNTFMSRTGIGFLTEVHCHNWR